VPKTRLTGSGGANDIASGCQRVIIMLAHEKKRFAERVDYLTSPGYLSGGDARAQYPFRGGGPVAIVTTLGILRPDPETKEFQLDGYFAFSSPAEIRAQTGWDLQSAPALRQVPEPTEEELAALRRVDVTGALRRN
jgi:glutaconate CoA-transferase subunit B